MPNPKHHQCHSSLCRKPSMESTAEQCFSLELHMSESGAGADCGVQTCLWPRFLAVPPAELWAGPVATGLPQAVLLWHWHKRLHDILASQGWKSPAWGNNAWYSNFLSSSSCLQIKYASKPQSIQTDFREELYLCERARSGPLLTAEEHKQLLDREKI